MINRSVLVVALAMGSAVVGPARQAAAEKTEPPAPRAQVLVLGVYHMSNPGRDIVNMKVDDVLAAKRQAEIARLTEVLKRFGPTKIAVEDEVGSERYPKRYADYLAGKHELTSNESRLASALPRSSATRPCTRWMSTWTFRTRAW